VNARRAGVVVAAALAVLGAAGPAHAAGLPVHLRSADGVALAGAVYDAAEPTAAVVLVHMYTRAKDDWRAVAERLQGMDITALAIDLRGHGGSSGPALPSVAMAGDVRAAVTFLSARVHGRPVGIVGASLGASLALLAAADEPGIRAVALVSPALDYRGVRVEAALARYGARPMLLIASTGDPYALRTLRAIAADAPPGREQHLSAVPAHGTRLVDADPETAAALVDWLRRTLLS